MAGTDFHTHLAPALQERLAGARCDGDLLQGRRVGPAELYRPAALEQHLDVTGLDRAVVTIPPPFYRQHLASDQAAEWARGVNDGLLATVDGRQRLLPLAYLPLEHPEVALAEYRRVRADARFAGVTASAGGRSRPLDAPESEPLLAQLDADARLLLLHPGTSPDNRLEPHYLTNLLGNPAETALATAQLVLGGVLPRYSRLRILLVHCGGGVPAMVGRWQRGVDTARPGIRVPAEGPWQAVRRLWVDSLAHDPGLVDQAVAVFGPDRMLLGSDWPFPMGTPDPASQVQHRGADFVQRVAVTNAAVALGARCAGSYESTWY